MGFFDKIKEIVTESDEDEYDDFYEDNKDGSVGIAPPIRDRFSRRESSSNERAERCPVSHFQNWFITRWAGIVIAAIRYWGIESTLKGRPCMFLTFSCQKSSTKVRNGRKGKVRHNQRKQSL